MSDNPVDETAGAATGAKELLARAAAAEVRAHRGLAVAIDDFFLAPEARLDEHARFALAALLRALVDTVEAEIREHGARLLSGRGESTLAVALNDAEGSSYARLSTAGLLRDESLMGELIARIRQDALGTALPMHAPDDPERPSLINRFVQHPDRVLAAGAMAVLIAESRRRASPETGQFAQTDLPAELHHRLVWLVAAALRDVAAGGASDGLPELDRAITEAARRSLAAHDEGERPEAAAMRFAQAIDAQAGELPQLLVEALRDRRIVLFTALLAHALGVAYEVARALVLEPSGDRLWLSLRAFDMPRETIAHIGYALCEADPRRDLESFADLLDGIAAVSAEDAREALGALRLDPDYRAAVLALQRAGTRR
jgi:hypothetical protein